MKKYLIAGFILLLPSTITLILILWLFDLLTTPFVGIFKSLLFSFEKSEGTALKAHQGLVIFASRVVALIFLFLLTLVLGFIGRKFFFRTLITWTNRLFLRIPFIKSIYSISRDVTNAFFTEGKKTFQQSVLVPFSGENTHALGFVTGNVPEKLQQAINQLDVSVFVPTCPHPISGFLLLTPKKNAIDVDLTTEDVFKFLLSCGTMHPGETPPTEGKPASTQIT